MPNHWGFVALAYGLSATVLGLYWRRLVRREREVETLRTTTGRNGGRTS